MLATGKHPIQNRFAMLGMTAWVVIGNCPRKGNLLGGKERLPGGKNFMPNTRKDDFLWQ